MRLIIVAINEPDATIWLDADAIAAFLRITPRHVRRIAKQHHVPKRGQLYELTALRDAWTRQAVA